jgi:tetrahydromethanopterin S-methyltransferase subunit H
MQMFLFSGAKTLFKFGKEQKTFRIGNIEVGGQPGELPTVLIGTIFYQDDRIVENEKTGEFDKQEAEEFIVKQSELSEKTGNPCMLNVVGFSPDAICRYVNFVANRTDVPILVYSPSTDVKIAAVQHCAEVGISDRIIYNHIAYFTREEELTSLREAEIKSAVILAFNLSNPRSAGRIEILNGTSNQESLLKLAERSEVKNILVDGAPCDIPGVGLAAKAISLIKEEFGLPAGGSPYRQLQQWTRLNEYGVDAKKTCMAGCMTILQSVGADFLFYGPIKNAKITFPAVAMTDAMIAYAMREEGIKTKTKNHPLYKIF